MEALQKSGLLSGGRYAENWKQKLKFAPQGVVLTSSAVCRDLSGLKVCTSKPSRPS